MKKIKLLYVDDEEINIQIFKTRFGKDYDIIAVESGKEALDIFKQEENIAIVLADQRMTGMSGVELLEQVYHLDPDPVRMILTGYKDVGDIIDAINRGHIYSYIVKSAGEKELRVALDNARDKYFLLKENQRLLSDLERQNIAVQKMNTELKNVNDLLAQDIVKRKKAEEYIRNLTQRLITVQEEERQRISFDLHDKVAQDLSYLKIGCETFFDDCPAVPEELCEKVKGWTKRLQDGIETVRDISYGLRPPTLDHMGLFRTVHQYCDDFCRQHGLALDFHSVGVEGLKFDYGIEITLYRLTQEALNNIHKHAGARRVTVRFVASYPFIILRIEDDGKGFDAQKRLPEAKNEKCMGVQGMEERVKLLRGSMNIKSCPGEGSRIFIEVPYEIPDKEE